MLNFKSVQKKILLGFMSVVLLLSITITGSALYIFSEKMMESQREEVTVGMQGLEDTIEESKLAARNYGIFIASHPEVAKHVENQDSLTLIKILEPYQKQANLDSIIVLDLQGNVLCRDHDPFKKGDSLANQYVIKNALAGVVSTETEKGKTIPLAIRAGIPIRNSQGQIVGAISVGYNINNKLVDTVKEKFGVEATVFMEDTRVATTIMNDGQRVLGTKASQEVAEKVLRNGNSHIGIVDVVGVGHIAAYKPLLGADGKPLGVLFSGHSLNKYYEERNKLFYTIAAITFFATVLSWFIARTIGCKIAKPLEDMVKGIAKDENGNISIRTVKVTSRDEIGQLNVALNALVNQVQAFVQHVSRSVEMVSASSEELAASSEQSAQAANLVAIAITDVASSAEKQSRSQDHAVEIVTSIGQRVRHGADKATNTVFITKKAVDATQRGSEGITTLTKYMEHMEQTVVYSAESVAKLGIRSRDIGKIVDTISGIAGQTNLLALNAAIEAARAGEQGRSFAVVADEVRKLAEQSAGAAKEIARMIGEVQGETQRVVEAMDAGAIAVKEGTGLAGYAKREFEDIENYVHEITEIVSAVAIELSQLTVSCTSVIDDIGEMDRVGKEVMGQTQTISASAEEQSATMQEFASASQSLAKLGQDLQNEVIKFTF